MAGQLFFWLAFSSFLNYFLCADLFEKLNMTRVKTTQYDELYNDALYAYNLKNYTAAAKYFEQAIADNRHQREVKLHCRSKCGEKFRKSLGYRNIGAVLRDIELEYFRSTIYSRKCSQICREKYLGKRSAVAARVDEAFKDRKPYSFLQFAYYKTGRIIKAAQAAYTYLEASPNDELMLSNMKYYKTIPIIADEVVFSLEPIVHHELYFKSVRLYEEQKWNMAIESFEETLKEYYKAYTTCKLVCEETREKSKHLGRTGLYGVYLDVLSCRSQCPLDLAIIKGTAIRKYLPRHYNYLQMSYWKDGKVKEAAECATSYLLMDPDDDNMIDNLKFYRYKPAGVSGTQTQARKEVVDYHREIALESNLLHLALMYKDEDDDTEGDTLFEDAEEPDTNDDNGGKRAEDLVDGEDLDYSAIKLSGLGPLKDKSQLKSVEELLKDIKYKGINITMTEEELNGTSRFVADNFLSQDECQTLMDLAKKTATLGDGYTDRSMPGGVPFSFTEKETFEGVTPTAAAKAILDGKTDVGPVDLYLRASEKVRNFVEDYFQLETPLYFSYTHMVCRTSLPGTSDKPHISHPVHSDNCLLNHDGPGTCPKRPPAYTWRDYSAILYLNEDFKGGEFIFAHINETIQAAVKPTCGRMVGFSAGVENLHGVLGVEGRRCAIALWFTLRVKHDEPARLSAKKIILEAIEKTVGKDRLKQRFAAAGIQGHAEL